VFPIARLDMLLQSCAPGKRAAIADLLAGLRAPKSAQLLQVAVANTHQILVRLTDDAPNKRLRFYRDAASECLVILSRDRKLSDESYLSAEDIDADPIYKILAQDDPEQSWEKRALQSVLLMALLAESPFVEDITNLAKGVGRSPVIPGISAPDLVITQCLVLCRYLSGRAHKEVLAAKLTSAIERYLQDLLQSAVDPKAYELSLDLTEALDRLSAPGADEPKWDPSERLRKLATSLSVRCSAAIHHQHRPTVHQVPPLHQLLEFLEYLKRRNQGLYSWAATHTLLSSHAMPLLGGAGHRRVTWTRAPTPRISILAPDLSTGSRKAVPSEKCESVLRSIDLPVLKAIGTEVLETNEVSEEVFAKRKQQFRDFCTRWAAMHGVRISLGAIHRLLPLALGGGAAPDETFCHLLALREVTRRDAGIHYFSPAIHVVTARYREAVSGLARYLGLQDWIEEGWHTSDQDSYFGASMRPSISALRELIQYLRHLARLPRGKPTIDNRLLAYNAEAARVTLMFLAATGARPVEDVLPNESLVNSEVWEILLSEKDSLLYRSTRKLPLAPRVFEAIAGLVERQRALAVQFGCRFDCQSSVFLVDKSGGQHAPTIANLKEYVPEFRARWPWPNDILRHHFRSRLWELGCSATTLELAMGHLGKSQTPDSEFAMRSIGEPASSLRPYADQLLDELGF
jgi:beta-phosphoglucomutase-like phosphatase (HAD superfamily)